MSNYLMTNEERIFKATEIKRGERQKGWKSKKKGEKVEDKLYPHS